MKNTDTLGIALELAINDPQKVNDFYHTLLQSDIYVITQDNDLPEGETVLGQKTKLSIVQIHNQNNQSIFPFFSSTEKIANLTNEGVSYCQLNFQVFLQAINFAPCVLNPNSQYSKEFTTVEFESLFGKSSSGSISEHTAKAGEQLVIGQPKVYPEKLIKILKECFSKYPAIAEGYIAEFYLKGDSTGAHPLIAIKSSDELNTVINDASNVIQRELSNTIVDFIDLAQDDELSDYFKEIEPFYKNGR